MPLALIKAIPRHNNDNDKRLYNCNECTKVADALVLIALHSVDHTIMYIIIAETVKLVL